ncbi:MAG: hypothetical protein KGP28_06905 [Bdellovibrionales bacterium]|nr:hypothetical protein [Bdellovibrionales bacterium]
MRQSIATGASSIAHLFTGDRRLKRVAVKIKAPKLGDREHPGYALLNELSENMFSFFCTEKFSIDEELEIQVKFSGHDLTYRVTMSHLHEEISSGRIMNALPSENNPFPARKFYRCFSKVLELKGMEKTPADSEAQTQPTPETPKPEETNAA